MTWLELEAPKTTRAPDTRIQKSAGWQVADLQNWLRFAIFNKELQVAVNTGGLRLVRAYGQDIRYEVGGGSLVRLRRGGDWDKN